jgi:hypothetical protein
MIDALRSGRMALDEVAQHFRLRAWSRTRQPQPQNYEQLAVANLQDPEPLVPGSIDEVTAAYDRGDLTADEYDVLCKAVADAINAGES